MSWNEELFARSVKGSSKEGLGQESQAVRLGFLGALDLRSISAFYRSPASVIDGLQATFRKQPEKRP